MIFLQSDAVSYSVFSQLVFTWVDKSEVWVSWEYVDLFFKCHVCVEQKYEPSARF